MLEFQKNSFMILPEDETLIGNQSIFMVKDLNMRYLVRWKNFQVLFDFGRKWLPVETINFRIYAHDKRKQSSTNVSFDQWSYQPCLRATTSFCRIYYFLEIRRENVRSFDSYCRLLDHFGGLNWIILPNPSWFLIGRPLLTTLNKVKFQKEQRWRIWRPLYIEKLVLIYCRAPGMSSFCWLQWCWRDNKDVGDRNSEVM